MKKNKIANTLKISKASYTPIPTVTCVAAAVLFALYGPSQSAIADSSSQTPDALQEITVTATRSVQTLEAVPYSLSVISANQINASGATDIASLAAQVPGLSMYDYGARFAEPGWIRAFGLVERSNNGVNGTPVLANPGDPVNSPPIYSSRNDWNSQRTFSGRASLLFKPNDLFSAELATLNAHVSGDGGTGRSRFRGRHIPLGSGHTVPGGRPLSRIRVSSTPFNSPIRNTPSPKKCA